MASDFDLTDLRSFAAAVRAGSITRGAVALGLSQPVVSQRIQRLERAVGERILFREQRGARVTPPGETLLAYAERMLALHDEAQAALSGRRNQLTGQRTIGLLEDLAITTLPEALADFATLHPQVSLEVIVSSAAALRRLADRGRLDLVFGDPTVMPAASVRWQRHVPMDWAFTPSFDTAADPLPLVLFSHPCRWRQPVIDAISRTGRRWTIAFQSTSVHAVQAAIAAGIGLGALLTNNIPPSGRRASERGGLPPAPAVEIAIARRAGADADAAVNSLERLLRRSVDDIGQKVP
ncbi:LysR family transcriptional regulator [Kribbella capetownensis]|uniref:LysR family transcriptional regulator n=1 Tax=Kribbella capetownensis TaxID=1572659 RepID=A0A4R0IWX4_9ACTN|nr:LysR substrate-binding domain-containing protein [Kribbella capetownensis]TCC37400.1 LysR family transcriptional regulator [Kribbella capetownensis]